MQLIRKYQATICSIYLGMFMSLTMGSGINEYVHLILHCTDYITGDFVHHTLDDHHQLDHNHAHLDLFNSPDHDMPGDSKSIEENHATNTKFICADQFSINNFEYRLKHGFTHVGFNDFLFVKKHLEPPKIG
jgi:hypothetical protein